MSQLKKNWENKLLAGVAALLLWLFVAWTENNVYMIPEAFEVEVENLSSGVSLANDIGEVKLKLKAGSDINLKNLTSADFDISVDAGNLNSGSFDLPVKVVSKDPKVSVVEISPASVEVKLEAVETKEVNITVVSEGEVAEGFELLTIESPVKKVKVTGANSQLEKVKDFEVKIALKGNENADFSKNVNLEAPLDWEMGKDNVVFEPVQIKVDLEIRRVETPDEVETVPDETDEVNPVAEEDLVKKTIMVEIVGTNNWGNQPKEVLPKNILLTVEGTEEEINAIVAGEFKVNLNENRLEQGGVIILTPSDISMPTSFEGEIVSFSPERILIRF
ncbi:MAG: CdaR family protein [Candidatus Altimarinota bacterium]